MLRPAVGFRPRGASGIDLMHRVYAISASLALAATVGLLAHQPPLPEAAPMPQIAQDRDDAMQTETAARITPAADRPLALSAFSADIAAVDWAAVPVAGPRLDRSAAPQATRCAHRTPVAAPDGAAAWECALPH